jgi:hypothetical protein
MGSESVPAFHWIAAISVLGFGYLRATAFATPFNSFLTTAGSAAIVVGCVYALIVSRLRFRLTSLLLIAAFGLSLLSTFSTSTAVFRWLGWAMLTVLVGPALLGDLSLRRALWKTTVVFLYVVTGASLVWAILGLPAIGSGAFAGIAAHSMILSPISALTAVHALSMGKGQRWWLWMGFWLAAGVICLMAGSRVGFGAYLAGSIATLLVVVRFHPAVVLAALMSVCLLLILGSTETLRSIENALPARITERAVLTRFEDTRGGLWEARWAEFQMSPFIGVGFASAIFTSQEAPEGLASEPGSSYLAILSMTGIIGVAATLFQAVDIGATVRRRWKSLVYGDQVIVFGWGCAWAVHLVAEGYILAVGSTLCMIFWLWVGYIADLGSVGSTTRRLSRERVSKSSLPMATGIVAGTG